MATTYFTFRNYDSLILLNILKFETKKRKETLLCFLLRCSENKTKNSSFFFTITLASTSINDKQKSITVEKFLNSSYWKGNHLSAMRKHFILIESPPPLTYPALP